MEMIPTVDGYHLLVGLKDEKVVFPKKILKKRASKKIVEEVAEGGEKSESSYKFDDVFDVDCVVPSPRSHKIKGTRF